MRMKSVVPLALISLLASIASCSDDTSGHGGAGGEPVGKTQEAIVTCVNIQRGVGSAVVNDDALYQQYPTYNEGNGPNLRTGKTNASNMTRSLIRFDLGLIPAGATITSATATLYASNNGNTTVKVHRVTNSWTESTVTWNNFAAAFDSTVLATFTTGGWTTHSFDLTAQVQAWYAGTNPNFGILLEEDTGTAVTGYNASEGGTTGSTGSIRPLLRVCYDTGSTTASTSTATSTASSTAASSTAASTSASTTAASTTVASSSASSSVSSSASTTASSSDSSSASTGSGGGNTTTYRVAVIGDYGAESGDYNALATMVLGWNPDAIITTGDNVYSSVSNPYDLIVGQKFHTYIFPYSGSYGAGSSTGTNRFFPIPGNHDWDHNNLTSYQGFFGLPGNERYYDKQLDSGSMVHLFALDADPREPDGNTITSVQHAWFTTQMNADHSCFKLVTIHEPPYCSTLAQAETSDLDSRWDFQELGADLVMSGSRHDYERLNVNGLTYIVNGAGQMPYGQWNIIEPHSVYRFPVSPTPHNGAMLITVTVGNGTGTLVSEFYAVGSSAPADSITLTKTCN
jgi:hypothetical protein